MPVSDNDVVIVDGVRTPFAKAGTQLKTVHPVDLGRAALVELIARTELPVDQIDEVVIGNTGSPADAVNISRVIALNSGIPRSVSAYTVHRNCASALQSVTSGYEKIKAGVADIIIAGGSESMSQMPLIFPKSFVDRFEKLGAAKSFWAQMQALGSLVSAEFKMLKELLTTGPMQSTPYKPVFAIVEGLTDPFVGLNMGQTAEVLAKEFGISRKEQDEFALRSHQRATASKSKLAEEITPVTYGGSSLQTLSEDIGPRANQSLEALQKLKPIFDRKEGTVTAGNSCPITDGAAMLVLMSRKRAKELGHRPKFSIRGFGFAGLEPERMGLGPVMSTPLALKKAGLSLKEIGLVELNEAFAAQVLACQKAFASAKFAQERLQTSTPIGELSDDILNVNGGAVALGHPVGATGSRLVLTLMKEMERRSNVQFGLATLCIGGGQGGALVLEKEQ